MFVIFFSKVFSSEKQKTKTKKTRNKHLLAVKLLKVVLQSAGNSLYHKSQRCLKAEYCHQIKHAGTHISAPPAGQILSAVSLHLRSNPCISGKKSPLWLQALPVNLLVSASARKPFTSRLDLKFSLHQHTCYHRLLCRARGSGSSFPFK